MLTNCLIFPWKRDCRERVLFEKKLLHVNKFSSRKWEKDDLLRIRGVCSCTSPSQDRRSWVWIPARVYEEEELCVFQLQLSHVLICFVIVLMDNTYIYRKCPSSSDPLRVFLISNENDFSLWESVIELCANPVSVSNTLFGKNIHTSTYVAKGQ
jgi:hypothetical protein